MRRQQTSLALTVTTIEPPPTVEDALAASHEAGAGHVLLTDVQQLKGRLATLATGYEARLRNALESIPAWVPCDLNAVYDTFRFPASSRLNDALLGASASYQVAESMEAFLARWWDGQGQPLPAATAYVRQQFNAEAAEMEELLYTLESDTLEVVRCARYQLDHMLDAVLADVEAQRQADVEALEHGIRSGEHNAHDGREELAKMWEEQRGRASYVRDMWAQLDRFIREGEHHSVEAGVNLTAVLENACAAYNEGQVSSPAAPPAPPASTSQPPAQTAWTALATSHAVVYDSAEFDSAELHGPTLVDPPRAMEPPAYEAAQRPPSAPLQAIAPAPPEAAPRKSGPQRARTRQSGATAAVESATPAWASSERAPRSGDAMDVLNITCRRTREGWQKVEARSMVGVLAPPVAILAWLSAWSVGAITGATSNPFDAFGIPTVLAAASMAWLGAGPWLLQWRPLWDGLRPSLVYHDAITEEGRLLLTDERMVISRKVHNFKDLVRCSNVRWESPETEEQGYMMNLDFGRQGAVSLCMVEQDRDHWLKSSLALIELDDDAWEVDATSFDTIRERLA